MFFKTNPSEEEKEKATSFVSTIMAVHLLIILKPIPNKQVFLPPDINAFISFKVCRSFAVVLEDPVAANKDEKIKIIALFSKFCYENGLKDIYYRVPKESLEIYKIFLEETYLLVRKEVVDLQHSNLEGGEKKSILEMH